MNEVPDDGDGHTLSCQRFISHGDVGLCVIGLPQPQLVFGTRKYAAGNEREYITVNCTREALLQLAYKIQERLGTGYVG